MFENDCVCSLQKAGIFVAAQLSSWLNKSSLLMIFAWSYEKQ